MNPYRPHYYEAVPKLGNVAVSRHAQDRMDELNITVAEFEDALLHPTRPDIPDTVGTVFREKGCVRIVVLEKPVPWRGAKLITTVFRISANSKAIKR